MRHISYLALGDSYTIGEQVPLHDSFPYQTIQLLRKQFPEHQFLPPEIVAKTGWTTQELSEHIFGTCLLKHYDFVTLLIGVNNQYRGQSIVNYKAEFEGLLQKAIAFSGGNNRQVFVLSIPDWGVTPFAEGRDRDIIAAEIDQFNNSCKQIALFYECHFIDITSDQRKDKDDDSFLAEDKLHPSGKEYVKWAKKLIVSIATQLNE